MEKTVARILEDKGSEVWTVAPDASVYAALEVMADKGVGALVVVEEERPVGIISERDYARKVVLMERSSHDTPVSDIMTADLVVVAPEDSTAACMEMMTNERIRHLPVVVDGVLVGIVSIGDVVRSVIDQQRFMIEQLEGYITG
jgi:CBS domain-containing protein